MDSKQIVLLSYFGILGATIIGELIFYYRLRNLRRVHRGFHPNSRTLQVALFLQVLAPILLVGIAYLVPVNRRGDPGLFGPVEMVTFLWILAEMPLALLGIYAMISSWRELRRDQIWDDRVFPKARK